MPAFNGQLNANEIFGAIFNMIISQQVFADNIDGTYGDLAELFRVDGSSYGDSRLYYSTDALRSYRWNGDAESANLLQTYRPKSPKCQKISISVFRQIPLTVDNYLTKRAWSTEGAFSEFNSVMLGWMRSTKRIYDATTMNTYVGTTVSEEESQRKTVTLPTVTGNLEAQNRLRAQTVATFLANLLVGLKDTTRDYNDYHHIRSYNPQTLVIVWNADFKNQITNLDLPTIFHEQGLLDMDADMKQIVLPARFFGNVNASAGTVAEGNTTIRSLIEEDYVGTDGETIHLFPGELLPDGAEYEANETYTQSNNVVFKIMHKRSVPFMSGFETGTSFFNPKSLNENHYLTWGHNPLEYLKNYPFITVETGT